MKKVYVVFICLLFINVLGYCQQAPQFSQYMFNNLSINPAYAGMNDAICANLFHRQQWVGFEGRPITTLISVDDFFRAIHGGLGLTIVQDQIAQFNNLDAKLSYSYHYNLGEGTLAGGLSLGIQNQKIDFSKFQPIDESDPILSSQTAQSAMAIDLGLGLFYQVKDKYYVGLSSSELYASKESYTTTTFDLTRNYYVTAGYHFSLEQQGLSGLVITPSTLIKTDAVSLQFDLNGMVDYNNKFWAGISYRKTDAVVIMIGLKPFGPGVYENLKIGYSYDLTTSAIGADKRSSGSHEIYVGYCFKIQVVKLQSSYKNVRFL